MTDCRSSCFFPSAARTESNTIPSSPSLAFDTCMANWPGLRSCPHTSIVSNWRRVKIPTKRSIAASAVLREVIKHRTEVSHLDIWESIPDLFPPREIWAKGIEASTFEAGYLILARFVHKGGIPKRRLHMDLRLLLILGGSVKA